MHFVCVCVFSFSFVEPVCKAQEGGKDICFICVLFFSVSSTVWQVPSCPLDPWVHLFRQLLRPVNGLVRTVTFSLLYLCQFASHALKLWYQMHKHGVPDKLALCNSGSGAHCSTGNSSLHLLCNSGGGTHC